MKTMKIGYYTLVWYDSESRQIVGDMGFSFCDAADTRFPAAELQANLESNLELHKRECYDYEVDGDDFAIYEVHTADGICEDSVFSAELDADTDKVVAVFVCATKEDAEGTIKEHYGKDIKAYYL